MHNKTIAELSKLLQRKEISSRELTEHFLNRIKKYDPLLNSFITVTEERALADAKKADEQLAKNQSKPLTGIPIAHKDIFCTKDIKTSCGSKMLDNFISPYDATVVKNLSNAGVVLLGKLNMDEFAMGSSNENSYYGPVKNPWNLETVPGGSSGGSSAAMAARLALAATGTDTGGSIRQPAALTGVTGIKPTYGRISRFGMIAFASSLDQAGPMTQTAEDAAIMLNAMAGFDPKDSTSIDEPVPDFTANLNDSIKNLKIGLPKEYFTEKLDPKIGDVVHRAADELQKLGASLHEISLPNTKLAIPVYYIIAPAECSSNLARYDGVRYGYRCKDPKDLLDLYERSRSEAFGDEVKHRIMLGTYVLSAGYYDAYYVKAQRIRHLISDDFQNAFKKVDVILGPTTPTTAFKFNSMKDRINMYLSDIFTVNTNLAGLPGISLPAGMLDGLPVGMQLTGNYMQEAALLNIAHQYQQVTDWHKQVPPDFNM
ncbi:MAG: Asp-tRNA(Asn)/Glu-tRNA(Gln) amidotransferase subunit GatA [Gammaproteobacteria bacterium]